MSALNVTTTAATRQHSHSPNPHGAMSVCVSRVVHVAPSLLPSSRPAIQRSVVARRPAGDRIAVDDVVGAASIELDPERNRNRFKQAVARGGIERGVVVSGAALDPGKTKL
jgi:hypothetical protein